MVAIGELFVFVEIQVVRRVRVGSLWRIYSTDVHDSVHGVRDIDAIFTEGKEVQGNTDSFDANLLYGGGI